VLQLQNDTEFNPAFSIFANEQCVDCLYIIIRATFDLGSTLTLAKEQLPPQEEMIYWGDPLNSSIKYAGNYHTPKLSTDVVLIGHGWAPDGNDVEQFDVSLSVAEKHKVLRLFGNRYWQNGAITTPEPFQSIPIVYELAYGGSHIIEGENGEILVDERNPIGLGFRGKRSESELNGLPLPNIEDPDQLLVNVGDESAPVGFGYISPAWIPRKTYAGTYDDAWQKTRAPYLPEDYNPRFMNSAHPDFIFDRYLLGGEDVFLHNLHQQGPLNFKLPQYSLICEVMFQTRIEQPPVNLETVLIEPDDNRVSLVWRAEVPCDKEALSIYEIKIGYQNV